MKSNWQSRLRKVFLEMKAGSRPRSLSIPALKEIVNAPNSEELARYALTLADRGKIRVQYRVLSPDTKSPIAEYSHFYQIPKQVFDETSDTYVSVKPSRDVEIVYSVSEI